MKIIFFFNIFASSSQSCWVKIVAIASAAEPTQAGTVRCLLSSKAEKFQLIKSLSLEMQKGLTVQTEFQNRRIKS